MNKEKWEVSKRFDVHIIDIIWKYIHASKYAEASKRNREAGVIMCKQ